MVFVELFGAHHTLRSTLFTRDPPPAPGMTTLTLHETSEYELYDTYAFHLQHAHQTWEFEQGQGQQRHGHDPRRRTTADSPRNQPRDAPQPPSVALARRRLSFADVGSCCVYADGSAVAGCDAEAMHGEMATTYGLDFISCHSPLRPKRPPDMPPGGSSVGQEEVRLS